MKKTNCSPSSFLMPTVGDCYLYFIFTTEQTLSEFGAQLPTLAWKETDYRILDGTDLFSLINIGGHVGEYKRLSLADNDGSTVEQRNAMPKFQRHYRQFEDTTGKLIQIDFYETAVLNPDLDLGGEPMQGNVVVIGFNIGLARLQ